MDTGISREGNIWEIFHLQIMESRRHCFELLRDGDKLAEHLKRFEPGDIYHQSIQQGRGKGLVV